MSTGRKLVFILGVNKFFDNLNKEIKRIKRITDIKKRLEEAKEIGKKVWHEWNSKIHTDYCQYGGSEEFGVFQDINQGFHNITGENSSYYSLKNLISDTRKKLREGEESSGRTQKNPHSSGNEPARTEQAERDRAKREKEIDEGREKFASKINEV